MQFGKSPRFQTSLPDAMHVVQSAGAGGLPSDCMLTEIAREMLGTYPSAVPAGGAPAPPMPSASSTINSIPLADVAAQPLSFAATNSAVPAVGSLPVNPAGGLPAAPTMPAIAPAAIPGIGSSYYFVKEAPALSRFALASPVDL